MLILTDFLDIFWQTIPTELLHADLWRSIWYLHSQPPLFNLYGGLFIKFFYPHQLQYMNYAHIILGALLSGMLYTIIFHLTGKQWVALLTAAVLALNPALFLFEASLLYTLLAAFWVVLSMFCLTLFAVKRKPGYAYTFVLSLNVLILTRSVYHPIILLIGVPVVCLLAGTEWRKVLVGSLLISALSLGWYSKSYVQFGFFGGSSWQGLGLWKVASANYTGKQLEALVEAGVIDSMVVDKPAFSGPLEYRKYGFEATSDIDVLSRNNFNHINLVAISKVYGRNALRLITYNPLHYLENVFDSYKRYSRPSSDFKYLVFNRRKIRGYENFSSEKIQGRALMQPLKLGSFLFFLLPTTLIFYFKVPLQRCRLSLRKWMVYIRADAVMFFTAFVIMYTTLVSCSFELGENERFKFLIEQPMWVFMAVLGYRAVSGWLDHSKNTGRKQIYSWVGSR